MYFFQATGLTDQKSLVNFAFGLINTEKEEGFQWLYEQLNQLREEVEAPVPAVAITDKEAALRNALSRVFPNTQQQLCVYHINANVRVEIKTRWKDLNVNNSDDSDEDDANDANDAEPDLDLAARDAAQAEGEEGIASPPQPTDYNREGMLQAWRNVVFANKEAD